jgi:pimeloyl-ACP methyl ester carboxylesterase
MTEKVSLSLFDSRTRLADHSEPTPPYFLKAQDLFVVHNGHEVFLKKIRSLSPNIPSLGNVVLAPGLATNANIFRIDDMGGFLRMDHNRSFANMLAARGFTVYLYHPGYTQRVHNRYVYQHCRESRYYHRRHRVLESLDFDFLVNVELPLVLGKVAEDSGEDDVSWVGYSLGGMLMYAYLARNPQARVHNLAAIGSPVTLNQIFIRAIPYTNMATKALGFEEAAFVGAVSQNFVPITRIIRRMPGSVLKANPLSMFLWNPFNISGKVIKILLGKIVEPIPRSLENSFSQMIAKKLECPIYGTGVLKSIDDARRRKTNFLFFFGENDMLATPDSVLLAHEILTPKDSRNLLGVKSAGHVDLIVGNNAITKVWRPCTEWLVEKTRRRLKLIEGSEKPPALSTALTS